MELVYPTSADAGLVMPLESSADTVGYHIARQWSMLPINVGRHTTAAAASNQERTDCGSLPRGRRCALLIGPVAQAGSMDTVMQNVSSSASFTRDAAVVPLHGMNSLSSSCQARLGVGPAGGLHSGACTRAQAGQVAAAPALDAAPSLRVAGISGGRLVVSRTQETVTGAAPSASRVKCLPVDLAHEIAEGYIIHVVPSPSQQCMHASAIPSKETHRWPMGRAAAPHIGTQAEIDKGSRSVSENYSGSNVYTGKRKLGHVNANDLPQRKRLEPAKEPNQHGSDVNTSSEVLPRRGRGRPKKIVPPADLDTNAASARRMRGRPRKVVQPGRTAEPDTRGTGAPVRSRNTRGARISTRDADTDTSMCDRREEEVVEGWPVSVLQKREKRRPEARIHRLLSSVCPSLHQCD